MSTKTNLNRIGRTGPGSSPRGEEPENVSLKGPGFALFYFFLLSREKNKTRKCFFERDREREREKKHDHLEIKLCASLGAHFTHGRSAQRNFKMFAFVVVDRVLGLSFVADRSSEL